MDIHIGSFLILTSVFSICNTQDTNETTPMEYQVPTPPISSPKCVNAKSDCENDTDCYHRLFYAHTTCVTPACKNQCKTAILRLYETKFGRTLLHSDYTCLGVMTNSVLDCQLDPRQIQIHCALVKLMCELDDACVHRLDDTEANCQKWQDVNAKQECTKECSKSLALLYNHPIGKNFLNCTCWNTEEDALCQRMKDTVLGTCKSEALMHLEANRKVHEIVVPVGTDQISILDTTISTSGSRNSNIVPVTKRPKDINTRPNHASDQSLHILRIIFAFSMLIVLDALT